MVENTNFQMAIDLLCCHLGITEDEAKEQLGISSDHVLQQQVFDTHQALTGYNSNK